MGENIGCIGFVGSATLTKVIYGMLSRCYMQKAAGKRFASLATLLLWLRYLLEKSAESFCKEIT